MDKVRAILYCRVSTKGQAEEGYSLDQQLERLREYANEQGYVVVAEITDPGYSGAKLERPGLDRVRDLVAGGGVDIVLAQDRDRLSRNPDHMGYLRYEFAKHGTQLRGLNDRGDDSPVGRLTDGILDQIAQYERAMIMDRVRRNKRAKALQGQVVGGHHVGYGYRYVYDADGKPIGYEVDESTMRHVRRIFEEIAAGDGIRTVKDRLDSEFVPTPRGEGDKWNMRKHRGWSRPFIKNLILSDLYRPHTVEELRQMGVSETVLAGLDSERLYGVYRYDDIAVPVPDAGIDLATVEMARANVLSQRASQRAPSRAGARVWELSSGILRCGECGRAMQAEVAKPRQTSYFYCRCVGKKQGKADRCGHRTHYRAEEVEADVWDRVRGVYGDKELLQRRIREEFARKRAELSGPSVDVQGLKERLGALDRDWLKWQRAYAADAISVADLAARRAEIEEERAAIEHTLERAGDRETDLLALEAQERDILDRLDSQDLGEADSWTPEERANF